MNNDDDDGSSILPLHSLNDKKVLFAKWLAEKGISGYTADNNRLEVTTVDSATRQLKYDEKFAYHKKQEGFKCAVIMPFFGEHFQAILLPKVKGYNNKFCSKGGGVIFTPSPMSHGDMEQKTLYFMESPPKAMVMNQRGFNAVAGIGVDGICNSKGQFKPIYGDLEALEAYENLVILFDKDIESNENVRKAAKRLRNGLTQKFPSANVVIKRIPESACPEDATAGIDDCVVEMGEEWFAEFMAEPLDKELAELALHLEELNESYFYIHHPPCVMDRSMRVPMKVSSVRDSELPRTIIVPDVDRGIPTEVQPFEKWMRWKERAFCDTIVLKPGAGELVEDEGTGRCGYNIWRPGEVSAGEGSVDKWLAVYENAVPDAMERKVLYDSVAWMLQNRGKRLPKTFFLGGNRQGTGKSFFAQTLGLLIGRKNSASITAEQFGGRFNSVWATKEYVVIDDVDKFDSNQRALLKSTVTAPTTSVDTKNMVQYEVDNYVVIFVTSNNLNATSMELEDRRTQTVLFDPLVYYPGGSDHWTDLVRWRDHEGGLEALMGWFMRRGLEGFDPNAHPVMTTGRGIIKQANLNEYEAWASELIGDWEGLTGGCGRCVFTVHDVWALYETTSGNEVYVTADDHRGMAREHGKLKAALKNCGFRHTEYDAAGKPKRVRVGGGRRDTYWVLNDLEGDWPSSRVTSNVEEWVQDLTTKQFRRS